MPMAPSLPELRRTLFAPDQPAVVRFEPGVGVVAAVRQGDDGFIRLLLLDPNRRGHGLGHELLRAAGGRPRRRTGDHCRGRCPVLPVPGGPRRRDWFVLSPRASPLHARGDQLQHGHPAGGLTSRPGAGRRTRGRGPSRGRTMDGPTLAQLASRSHARFRPGISPGPPGQRRYHGVLRLRREQDRAPWAPSPRVPTSSDKGWGRPCCSAPSTVCEPRAVTPSRCSGLGPWSPMPDSVAGSGASSSSTATTGPRTGSGDSCWSSFSPAVTGMGLARL